MTKYHIALSFAGEDRDYVQETANYLRERGIDVFYDKFEETNLWGKNLFTYLSDIYQNKAMFTVMFISEAYKDKLWTNHERESAQARAFSENKEYILPAFFDQNIEVPGILKTTGYINLAPLSPVEFGEKIIQKLENDGVLVNKEEKFNYSSDAKADKDFPMPTGAPVTDIIKNLRSYNWPTQNPAIEAMFSLDLKTITPDELFVLGRNLYQTACGGEHKACEILKDLRREMAKQSVSVAEHLINGMFYEVYFDSNGNFRGENLKCRLIDELFVLQSVEKYADSINYVKGVLQPFRSNLLVTPNTSPETVDIIVTTDEADASKILDIVHDNKSILINMDDTNDAHPRIWRLSRTKFSLDLLKRSICRAFGIPLAQLNITAGPNTDDTTKYQLPSGKTVSFIVNN